ncbi:hypothetical protein B9479_006882 [Cryptococcus floricola]|uniref:Uncharacterized protein n=1 Tax=Cryptococcus floricola TaxID=2591691 RepID=A0A5D3ANX9_9TREE|nr:hypothetical protein B9479_006882 [Cryptococcus floricola]
MPPMPPAGHLTANTDTSSSSPPLPLLPAEVQDLIYDDFLSSDPSLTLARTLTLAKLSKSHYALFIPRLYKRIVVSDKALERGLYEGVSARRAGTEVVRGEGGPLGSKRDLLEHCESLVIPTLAARDATAEAARLWNGLMTAERYDAGGLPDTPGIFNNVAHIAFEPECLKEYCQYEDLMSRQPVAEIQRHSRLLKNLSHICFRQSYPSLQRWYDRYLEMFHGLAPFSAPGVLDTVGSVTRFQNYDMSGDSVASAEYVDRPPNTIIVDMLPLKHPGVKGYRRHVELIYSYCMDSFSVWGKFEKKFPGELPTALIFTNFGTTVSRYGDIHYISPKKKRAILQKAQDDIRRRLQPIAASESLDTGVVDKIFIRGYEECEFCGNVSHSPTVYDYWESEEYYCCVSLEEMML